MFLKLFLKRRVILIRDLICVGCIKFWWWLFLPYYRGLLVQAEYLYTQHFWYKERCRLIGTDFAWEIFEQDRHFFFQKAQRESICIRAKIFMDATREREPKPYPK